MVGAEAAVGPGPERGIFREVIPILAQRHTFWELRHSHLVPVFSKSISSPDPDRLQWFWAFGVFQALHLALFCQGAYNCSFALATAFILGEPGMLMTQDYVHAMDPKLLIPGLPFKLKTRCQLHHRTHWFNLLLMFLICR